MGFRRVAVRGKVEEIEISVSVVECEVERGRKRREVFGEKD
jgi:hypothetical protein